MTNDLWFMSIIIVGILFACGCYWAGVAYGKQEGRRIARDTRNACQLEIERVKKEAMEWREWSYTLSNMDTPKVQVIDFTALTNTEYSALDPSQRGPSIYWLLDHAQRKAASHDPDAG